MKTPRYTTPCLRTALSLAFLPLICTSLPARASTYTWTGAKDGSGDFNTPGSWSGSIVPGSSDAAVITGYSVNASTIVGIGAADNLTLGVLDMNESNTGGVTSTVNQTGGTVTTGTFTSGNTGASKIFTYNLSGGNLNITGSLGFGAGSSGSGSGFVVSGGTLNYTGANDLILGGNYNSFLLNDYITVTAGTFNFTPPTAKWLVVGQSGTGTINVGGTGKFNYDGNYNGALLLGQNTNSVGVMNVSGGVTSLTLNNGFYLGGYGNKASGTLNVSGGQVNIQNGGMYLGSGASGTGTINVTGGSVNFTSNGSITLGQTQSSTGNIAVTNGTFNYNGNGDINFGGSTGAAGTLTVGMGGVFNVTGSGNGNIYVGQTQSSTGSINITGGLVNFTTNGNLYLAYGGTSTGSVAVTNGTFNYNGAGNVNLGVGTSGNGTLTIGMGGVFNATSADAFYVGNGDGATGNVTLSDNGQLNTTLAVVGQYGSSAVGTLTIGGSASFNATKGVIVGGRYGGNSEYGVINLNGGNLTTPSISLGTTSVTASATKNVLNANGGTIVAGGTNGGTLVSGVYVNVKAGGLKVNTNGRSSIISASLNGDSSSTGGGLTVTGGGSLTLTGGGTYAGDTVVNGATLILSTTALDITGGLTLNSGKLQVGDVNDSWFIQSLGALKLESSSTIDFNSVGQGLLTFADSSSKVWNGTLTLANFDVGTDNIAFGDGSGAGLTATQLGQISLAGYIATGLDSFGDVEFTAVPEPSTWAIMISGGVGLLLMRRRRFPFAVISKYPTR